MALTYPVLDDLHSVPIEIMGQYKDKMEALQKILPRDLFEDEEAAKRREDTLFGNPYFKKKRIASSKQAQQSHEYPSLGSPDSIMNEADEEASHEFEKELTHRDRSSNKRKRHLGKRKLVPYLYKKSLLSVPSFKGLRWDNLEKFEYSFVAGLGDLAVESVVKELEQAPTTPSNTDPSPDTSTPSDSGTRGRIGQDFMEVEGVPPALPDLDEASSTAISSDAEDFGGAGNGSSSPFQDRVSEDMGAMTTTSSDDETTQMLRSDWSYSRKMIHASLSKWPKRMFLNSPLS